MEVLQLSVHTEGEGSIESHRGEASSHAPAEGAVKPATKDALEEKPKGFKSSTAPGVIFDTVRSVCVCALSAFCLCERLDRRGVCNFDMRFFGMSHRNFAWNVAVINLRVLPFCQYNLLTRSRA